MIIFLSPIKCYYNLSKFWKHCFPQKRLPQMCDQSWAKWSCPEPPATVLSCQLPYPAEGSKNQYSFNNRQLFFSVGFLFEVWNISKMVWNIFDFSEETEENILMYCSEEASALVCFIFVDMSCILPILVVKYNLYGRIWKKTTRKLLHCIKLIQFLLFVQRNRKCLNPFLNLSNNWSRRYLLYSSTCFEIAAFGFGG